MSKGVFRVNYQENGQPQTGFVVADTDGEAAAHFGVAGQSGVQVTKAMYPVEVAGVDPQHANIPSPPASVAPFDLPKSVSRQEFDALTAQLAELKAQVAGHGKPVE
jgi:hypothetical protein